MSYRWAKIRDRKVWTTNGPPGPKFGPHISHIPINYTRVTGQLKYGVVTPGPNFGPPKKISFYRACIVAYSSSSTLSMSNSKLSFLR